MRPARPVRRKSPTHTTEGAAFDTPRTYGNPYDKAGSIPARWPRSGEKGAGSSPGSGSGEPNGYGATEGSSPFDVAPSYLHDDGDSDESFVLTCTGLALICVVAYLGWLLLAAVGVK